MISSKTRGREEEREAVQTKETVDVTTSSGGERSTWSHRRKGRVWSTRRGGVMQTETEGGLQGFSIKLRIPGFIRRGLGNDDAAKRADNVLRFAF